MKKFDKNSQNRDNRSNDILIYILLLFLVVLLVGGGIWCWNQWQKKPEPVYDYKSEIGERLVTPTAEQVSQLIAGNRSRLKTVERVLNDKVRDRKLTASEKEEVRKELSSVSKELDKNIQGFELDKLEKDNPELLAAIYFQLYEQGKILTRLKTKTSVDRPYEEVWNQWKVIQPKWKITSDEEKEITEKMNKWITGWYNQAMEEVLPEKGEVKLTEHIVPLWVEGREVKGKHSKADVDHFRKFFEFKNGGSLDLTQPFQIKFLGYTGFLEPEDFKKSKEGKETFGVTFSGTTLYVGERENYDWAEVSKDNCRQIEIKLKKELFFNRLGYDEWIKNAKKEGNVTSRTYHDICFEEVVETIAHELAHAVVNSIRTEYEGEEKGGHGKLFHDLMESIEEMMEKTPEFSEFKDWWDLTK